MRSGRQTASAAARSKGRAAASTSVVACTARAPRRASTLHAALASASASAFAVAPRAPMATPSFPWKRSHRIRVSVAVVLSAASTAAPPSTYPPPRRSRPRTTSPCFHGTCNPPPAKKPSAPRQARSGGRSPNRPGERNQKTGAQATGTPNTSRTGFRKMTSCGGATVAPVKRTASGAPRHGQNASLPSPSSSAPMGTRRSVSASLVR